MRKTLALFALMGLNAAAMGLGCSSSKDEGPLSPFPSRGASSGSGDGGGSSSGGSSSGSSGTSSGGNADCTNHSKVDDRPACDQCARAKCCNEIVACDQSANCKALQDCLAACAEGDLFCQLACSGNEQAVNLLSAVGNCAKRNCPTECPSQEQDGGLDFDF